MMMTLSSVDLQNCAELKDPSQPFILVLHKGENVFDSLVSAANTMNIQSAALTGLGALQDPIIAYYHLSAQQYDKKQFPGIFELISFNGNLTWVDGKLFPHVHVALGDEKHQVIGGHLMSSVVGVTVEITIIPFINPIHRIMNKNLGLCLIC